MTRARLDARLLAAAVLAAVVALVAVRFFRPTATGGRTTGGREGAAARVAEDTPGEVVFVCGAALPCVRRLAVDLGARAEAAGRPDVAIPARDIAAALDARDCRGALAADERLDALALDPHGDAALFGSRVALMTELLNACMLASSFTSDAPPDAAAAGDR